MKRATYYRILGVDTSASAEEIRSSFRRLALRYHPDRNTAKTNAHAAFIAIHNAYAVLINETTRKEYDAYLAHATPRPTSGRRYSRKQDPRVSETLSMFNSTLWDLEDLLKEIDNKNMMHAVGRITIYDYVLNLLGYLENSILDENDRFSSFAARRSRTKLHLDNYFYSLRMGIEKYLGGLYGETNDRSAGLRKIVAAEAHLIKSVGQLRKCM